jgi:hypothetical protein
MSATTITLRGRVAAEALMVDACVIERRSGSTVDPETGDIVPTFATVYSGKCKVQQQTAVANPSTVGEAAVFVSEPQLHVPMSATGLLPDDRVTMTTSVLDPDLVGKVGHLRGPWDETFTTARRLPMAWVSG